MKKKVIVLVIWMLFLMSGCTSETADHSADNAPWIMRSLTFQTADPELLRT